MRPAQSFCGFRLSILIIAALFILFLGFGVETNAEEKRTHGIKEKVKERAMSQADKLTEEEGKYLVEMARKTIQEALFNAKDKS